MTVWSLKKLFNPPNLPTSMETSALQKVRLKVAQCSLPQKEEPVLKKKKALSVLARKLHEHSIPVLDKKAVRAYKKAMFQRQPQGWFPKFLVRIPSFIGVLAIFGTAIFALSFFCSLFIEGAHFWIMISLFAALGCATILGSLLWLTYRHPDLRSWQCLSYNRYWRTERAVPSPVEKCAQKIRILFPKCRLYVEFFGRDPFLVVRRGLFEKEYLVAWNERGLMDFDVL